MAGAVSHNITLAMPYIAQPALLITITSGESGTSLSLINTSCKEKYDGFFLLDSISKDPPVPPYILTGIYLPTSPPYTSTHNDLSLSSIFIQGALQNFQIEKDTLI